MLSVPSTSSMQTWDESQVVRVLEWSEKEPPGYVVADEPLTGISLDELREMFEIATDDPDDPPLFYKYTVEPRHVGRLQQAVRHKIDLNRFDYSVAAYQRGT